jgi:hypothetical protein
MDEEVVIPRWVWRLIRNANFGDGGGGDGGGGDGGGEGGGGDAASADAAAASADAFAAADAAATEASAASTGATGGGTEGFGAGATNMSGATQGVTGATAMGGLGTAAVGTDATLGGFQGGFGGSVGFGDPSGFGGSPSATGGLSTATGAGFNDTEASTAGMGITGAAAQGFEAPGGSSAPDSFGFNEGGFPFGDSPGIGTGVAVADAAPSPPQATQADLDQLANPGKGDQPGLAPGTTSVLAPGTGPGPGDTLGGTTISSTTGGIDLTGGGQPTGGIQAGGDFQSGGGILGGDVLSRGILSNIGPSALGGSPGGILTDTGNTGVTTGADGGTSPIGNAGGAAPGTSPLVGTAALGDFQAGGGGLFDALNGAVQSGQIAPQQGQAFIDLTHQMALQWAAVIPPDDPRWPQVMQLVQQQAAAQVGIAPPQVGQ